MANTIRIKRSTGSDAPSSLANAELAFAEGSKKLFIGIGTGGDGGSATSIEAIGGSGAFIDATTARNTNFVFAGPSAGSAAAPAFRQLAVADIPTLTASQISNFNATVQNNRIDQLVAPIGALSLNSQKITSLATPTSDSDAATKAYVDSVAEGLDVKESCQVATTANITLSGTQTIDGVAVSANDRVLVKDQSTSSQNGIYLCKASSWVRTDDLPANDDASGAFTFVEAGTTNADKGFVCTNNKGSATVGSDGLVFSTFSSSGDVVAGNGLQKSGNTLSAKLETNGGLVINGTSIKVKLDAGAIAGTLPTSKGGTGSISVSGARTNLGLAIGTDVEAHSDKLTELATMALATSQKLADLTSTEVGILDGATVTTAELNKLDGVTATTTEINYIDGVTSAIQDQIDGKQSTNAKLTELATMAQATANALADLTGTEVAILDGLTSTTAELNKLDGATVTTSEINILDGVTATTTEINKLDGLTATTTELNYTDGVTSNIQTQLNAKQASDAQLTELATMTASTAQKLADLTGTEVGILDGATVTTSELNKLDGVTTTTTELNIIDGGTGAVSTTLATADRFVCNDNGTMKQVALSDLVTFLEDGSTSNFDIDGGSY